MIEYSPVRDLIKEIGKQDAVYGPFIRSGPDLFHAIACAEEELWEARDAWRNEKKTKVLVDANLVPLFDRTGEELLQVAAVCLRAYRAIKERR